MAIVVRAKHSICEWTTRVKWDIQSMSSFIEGIAEEVSYEKINSFLADKTKMVKFLYCDSGYSGKDYAFANARDLKNFLLWRAYQGHSRGYQFVENKKLKNRFVFYYTNKRNKTISVSASIYETKKGNMIIHTNLNSWLDDKIDMYGFKKSKYIDFAKLDKDAILTTIGGILGNRG